MVRFLRISAILAIVGLVMNWLCWELPIWPSWLNRNVVAFLFESFVFPLYAALPIFLARNRAPWMFTAIACGMNLLISVLWSVLPMCGFNLNSALFPAISRVCECMFWVSLFVAQRRQTTLSRLKGPILGGLVLSSLRIFSSVSYRLLWLDAPLSEPGGVNACPDFVATAVGAGHGCLCYLYLVALVAFCLQLFRHVRETSGDPVRSVLSFGGRLRRRHFWLTGLALLPVASIVGFHLVVAWRWSYYRYSMPDRHSCLQLGFWCGAFFALFLVSLALRVRRLHDRNLSGGWVALFTLLGPIPLVGLGASVAELVFDCQRGTIGPNRFGPDPLGRDAPAVPPAPITVQPVPEPIVEPPSSSRTTPSVADRLSALADLRTRGLVTEDEYREKRAEILASL